MGTKLVVFFVALLCNFAADYSMGNRKLGQRFLSKGVPAADEDDDDRDTSRKKNVISNPPVLLRMLNHEQHTKSVKFEELYSTWAGIPRKLLRQKRQMLQDSTSALSPAPAYSPIYEPPGPSPSPGSQADEQPGPSPEPADQMPIDEPPSPSPSTDPPPADKDPEQSPTPGPSPYEPPPDEAPEQSPTPDPSPVEPPADESPEQSPTPDPSPVEPPADEAPEQSPTPGPSPDEPPADEAPEQSPTPDPSPVEPPADEAHEQSPTPGPSPGEPPTDKAPEQSPTPGSSPDKPPADEAPEQSPTPGPSPDEPPTDKAPEQSPTPGPSPDKPPADEAPEQSPTPGPSPDEPPEQFPTPGPSPDEPPADKAPEQSPTPGPSPDEPPADKAPEQSPTPGPSTDDPPADAAPEQSHTPDAPPSAANPPSQENLSPGPSEEDGRRDGNIIHGGNVSPHPPPQDNTIKPKDLIAATVASSLVVCAFVAICAGFYPRKVRALPMDDQSGGKDPPLSPAKRTSAGLARPFDNVSLANSKDVNAPSTAINSFNAEPQSTETDVELEGTATELPHSPEKRAAPPPPKPPSPPKQPSPRKPPPKPPSEPPKPPPKPPSEPPKPPPEPSSEPPPPPPPKPNAPAPPPPARPPNPVAKNQNAASVGTDGSEAHKTKLKPFFWDKVAANPNSSMVWNEIRAGSFQFNEEMIENLFGCAAADKSKKSVQGSEAAPRYIQIIDPKKAQNLAILIKASGVTMDEIYDALKNGDELPGDLCRSLLRMAPTPDEEAKLKSYDKDFSHLGPAERFLKVLVNIPFAFKRLESLLFVSTFQEEFSTVKESFETIELACNELRNSRLFLKLLEAVLKTGNRMNDGTYRGGASAFKLDALLKLSDVKGTDGKTTLLHFVVQEVSRSEGDRALSKSKRRSSFSISSFEDALEDSSPSPSPQTDEHLQSVGIQVLFSLKNELENVRKASVIDGQVMSESMSNLRISLNKTKEFLESELKNVDESENEFRDKLNGFVNQSESDIKWLSEEEKRIMALVKSTGDYFHGKAGKDEGLRVFTIVGDFLSMLDKACKDVQASLKLPAKPMKNDVSSAYASAPNSPSPSVKSDMQQKLFPMMMTRQMSDDFSSSEDD